ncbi:hypothetical protein [Hymenobacter mucosus]|uniref:Uncharacterized protein n=1 Tax=Hymenobacter mucosus TaxID=1411120 RepID=A0A239AA76_9BACT|nr:hypothetical protein [Hymenobacter mucosus]SNR92535.1 hypothetical protein SAMN06269173_111105 [Hymenobacter mucosus]
MQKLPPEQRRLARNIGLTDSEFKRLKELAEKARLSPGQYIARQLNLSDLPPKEPSYTLRWD